MIDELTEKTFNPIAKHLVDNPKQKKALADYLSEKLGEGREIRVNEVTRWLHPESEQRREMRYSIGRHILNWWIEQRKIMLREKLKEN